MDIQQTGAMNGVEPWEGHDYGDARIGQLGGDARRPAANCADNGRDAGSDPFSKDLRFSPGLERPYFFAQAWSRTTGYVQLPLAAPAQGLSEPFIGLYARYDALREVNPFDTAVETMRMCYQLAAAQQLPP
ncbi:MAG: hypothetical protein OXG68_04855 [Chloroflexi bacterium]|nr:hypothetical protein [Chloroflexota bacterium]